MIELTVTYRICGIEHEPDRATFTGGEWRACPSCRAAVRSHAERSMQHSGYAPPHPDSKHHDALMKAFDERWTAQLRNAEQFLRRVHELESSGTDDES